MRLNRFIALATGLSRRAADRAIIAGQVEVDGSVAIVGTDTSADTTVTYRGQRIVPSHHRYVALNKPVGYITSRASQGAAPTIYDLLPPQLQNLKPVGRLDKASQGLVLLTNDGDLAQLLTHPSSEHTKQYRLRLDRPLLRADQLRLARGVELVDGLSQPEIIQAKGVVVDLALTEGRNRQLRRTMDELGYRVKRLDRLRLGKLGLGELPMGQWREVKRTDIL